ncbi:alpha-glucosidase [Gammaproteobacteria bacterium]|nr:alpha-glucosidase [Gammaproteobacteria bacterium]
MPNPLNLKIYDGSSPESSGFDLYFQQQLLLRHRENAPCCFIGMGHETMDMYRGNFNIYDQLESREPLRHVQIITSENNNDKTYILNFKRHENDAIQLSVELSVELSLEISIDKSTHDKQLILKTLASNADINRIWWRIPAQKDEQVWGCGEQMSYFNLRKRNFPLWTSEPGVGRDKSTHLTWLADTQMQGGGDYYHTNYPQPTFVSSQKYCCHLQTTAYCDFDFKHDDYHELQAWCVPEQIEFIVAPSFLNLLTQISNRFGRQPTLPDWVLDGVILGLKRGETENLKNLETALDNGIKVSGLWCEDWAGVRQTSFGNRLFWDWQWNKTRFPNLPKLIQELNERGIRFLNYVSPYLCKDGPLYQEGLAHDVFAKAQDGGEYLVDFGEFECGVIDFTNPAATQWFKDRIIKQNMIDLGVSGWMADFGEYLPIDLKLHSGLDPKLAHNAWPPLWAQANSEAVAESGKTGEIVFFMRAGFTNTQKYCPLLWAGDQSVDFSRHDGLNTVICAALSSGLMGNAYHHSDIGGYTSLFGNTRTPELFMRWAEMAAFTSMMRTHECNRPTENFQFFEDTGVMAHLAKMTQVFVHLKPYIKHLIGEAKNHGWALQRPLFVHHEDDLETYNIQDQYLFGQDLLVAPVHAAQQYTWKVYLPKGENWVHIWSHKIYTGGESIEIPAPLGEPPVFYREGTAFKELFKGLAGIERL